MRRVVTVLIILQVMSSLYIWTPSMGAPPENSARAAVLMEVESGRVLYERILMRSCHGQHHQDNDRHSGH